MKVLILNHQNVECGVYQFGKRFYDIVRNSEKVEFLYREASSLQDFDNIINLLQPSHIIYNWYNVTMSWLTETSILGSPNIRHFFIFHEGEIRENYDKYLFFGDLSRDKNLIPSKKSILLPRPLLEYSGPYKTNEIFTIGTFGFISKRKGLTELIEQVNNEFDEAIINIHAPMPFFNKSTAMYKEYQDIPLKPGITLNISTDFLTDQEVLSFLAKNNINVFRYYNVGDGISSVIDYALSVDRPIAITDCGMFRHITNDCLLIGKYSIKEIYSSCISQPQLLAHYRAAWHPNNLIKSIEECFQNE